MKPEARYWQSLNGKVKCLLCPRECVIPEGQRGFCRIRQNINGRLIAAGYGEIVSIANDPIEKKPLYHFYPGSYIISTGCNGCNLGCLHCQNWQISQQDCPTEFVPPEALVKVALKYSSRGICFTYTEPLIWFEYIIDVAKLAREYQLPIVLVTNGQINPEPLKELLPFIDAMNVDLKSMRDEFYKKIALGGKLEATLNTIKEAHRSGVHVEVTNLIIPTLNDSEEEITALVDFISGIDPDMPVHFTRFFPHYKLSNLPPTPIETLLKAKSIADEKLNFVYVGNVPDEDLNTTFCPDCGEKLIVRKGFFTVISRITEGRCPSCGRVIPGRF
ncbi:MAG: AmmeMemoRadiSam system radical SAM enzyme [Deferribacteres bacterium]|nr:AmmeMemoRadiSam system radical SAM enzyme [Deferribacteres bacterium]